MAGIKKKEFSLDTIKNKYSTSTKYKPEQFYNCGTAFMEASGLPGPAMGSINMFLGHSNTSKTTALVLTAADAQKKGHLPVFIITEKKWTWKHAVELGLNAHQTEDGSWDGDFIFNDSFDYIEQATDFINEILDMQEEGGLPYNLVFLFDSIGSIPCKMTFEGRGGKMANASVLSDKIGMGIHSRITKTRKEECPYINTLIFCNQPWVDTDMTNPMAQPEIKSKGGDAIWLASSLVFLFGKQKKAGINHIDATKNGRKVSFAIRTRISILKNHINGLGYKDGKILAVHNGYISDTKEALDKYKKEYSEYWMEKLGGGDYSIEETNDDFEG
jgi:hypothetical protein